MGAEADAGKKVNIGQKIIGTGTINTWLPGSPSAEQQELLPEPDQLSHVARRLGCSGKLREDVNDN